MLKPSGRLISVAAGSKASGYFFYVQAKSAQLAEIARLIEEGKVRPIVDSVLPLNRAREAYERKPKCGKIVLQVIS